MALISSSSSGQPIAEREERVPREIAGAVNDSKNVSFAIHHHYGGDRPANDLSSLNVRVEQPEPEAVRFKEGSLLGYCLVRSCKQAIYRNYGPNGQDHSYMCCDNSCGRVCIHYECAMKEGKKAENFGKNLSWTCDIKQGNRGERIGCGESVYLDGGGAIMLSIWESLVEFRWYRFLIKWALLWLLFGFVFKAYWYVSVVTGHYPVDSWNNKHLVDFDKLKALDKESQGWKAVRRPKIELFDMQRYSFCQPSSIDWTCAWFGVGCGEMVWCARGFFWIDRGHLWMGFYWYCYFVLFTFTLVWCYFGWPQRIWAWWQRKTYRVRVHRSQWRNRHLPRR